MYGRRFCGAGIRRGIRGSRSSARGGLMVDLVSGGTFTRASEGSYQTAADAVAWASNDVRRFEDRGDGLGAMLLLEGPCTNQLVRSEEFDNASWVKTNVTVPVTNNNAPDNVTDADTIRVTGAGVGRVSQATVLAAAPVNGSVWLKKGATSQNVTLRLTDGTNTVTSVVTPTTTWTRYDLTLGTVGAAVTFQIDVGSAANDEVIAWGAQAEAGRWPTSYVRTAGAAATRVTDSLVYSPRPPAVNIGVGVEMYPLGTATEIGLMATLMDILSVNGISEELYTQSGTIGSLVGGFGGVARASGSAARHARWNVECTHGISRMRLGGDLSNVGDTTAAPYMWNGTFDMRVGGRSGGGGVPFSARYRRVYRA